MENLSAVVYGKDDLRMENWPTKEPERGEVQIAVRSAGLCMTDVHQIDLGGLGDLKIESPFILGHEFGGVINQVSPEVTNVKLGDWVAVDPTISCGTCQFCKRGYTNVCTNAQYIGFPSNVGGLTRFVTVPAQCAHKIPHTMSFHEAALIEPVAVCVSGVERTGVKVGDSVLVQGAGPIGLITLQIARARGASIVCVTDCVEERLKLAKELGATHTVLFSRDETDARKNAEKLQNAVGEPFDKAIECSGASVCAQTAIHALRHCGVIGIVGLGSNDVSIPLVDIAFKQIDIRGSISNNFCFPLAIKLVASGKVNVKPIISRRFPLEKLPESLDLVRKQKELKIVIDCSSE